MGKHAKPKRAELYPKICCLCEGEYWGTMRSRHCAECLRLHKDEIKKQDWKLYAPTKQEAYKVKMEKLRAERKAYAEAHPAAWTVTACRGCRFWRSLSGNHGDIYAGQRACFFLLDTGKVRGIPPDRCYLHPGTPYTPEGRDGR